MSNRKSVDTDDKGREESWRKAGVKPSSIYLFLPNGELSWFMNEAARSRTISSHGWAGTYLFVAARALKPPWTRARRASEKLELMRWRFIFSHNVSGWDKTSMVAIYKLVG